MKVIDLTHTIQPDMPVYPGTEPPEFLPANSYVRDGFRETLLRMYTHTGTHVDPPAHLYPGQTTLDRFPIDQFIGKALVVDCTELRAGQSITPKQLAPYDALARDADFLLFHLGWDRYWGTDAYFSGYPCVDNAVLDYILMGDYKGIGFDTIGLDPVSDPNLTRHRRLFARRDIINIENLTNLSLCGTELFWFSCFPLKLQDGDGSPVRAAAWFV